MRRRRFLASALASTGLWLAPWARAESALGLPGALDAGEGWRPTFRDDFDDPQRFEKDWMKVQIAGDNVQTLRIPENAVVADGLLDLELGHASAGKLPFTGGYVQTHSFRQRYGYFECEMRIAAEEGVNNAFWMVSVPETEGDHHFELDVAEVKFPDEIQGTARLWRPSREVASGKHSFPDLQSDFHRYGLLWGPERFTFFFDDEAYFEASNPFAHTPAQVRLSNAVARFAGQNDGDVRGAATSFRHVAIYQRDDWASWPAATGNGAMQ
jgi:beta-glucanase (GH16 family)